MSKFHGSIQSSIWTGSALALLLFVTPTAHAGLYKVVNPDGSITYTDRPPTASNARVTSMRGQGGAADAASATADAGLPADLRLVAQRYPVTLYTAVDCPACDSGRQWLAKRGVPYRERLVLTEVDQQALNLLVGGRSVPSLTIGQQPVQGFSETDWLAYLDAAGYPRESKLPRGWKPQAASPLVEPAPRPAAAQAPPRSVPPVADTQPTLPSAPAPVGTIKF